MGLSCGSIYFSTIRLPITQGTAHESHDNLCDLDVEAGRLFGGEIWTEKQVGRTEPPLFTPRLQQRPATPLSAVHLRNVVLFPKADWEAVVTSACMEDAQTVLLKCQCVCESPGELLKHASSLSNLISFPRLPLHITKTWRPNTTHTYYSTVLMARCPRCQWTWLS